MTVHAKDIYNRIGMDSDQDIAFPMTTFIVGDYEGSVFADYILGLLIKVVYESEMKGVTKRIGQCEGWSRLAHILRYVTPHDDATFDAVHYGIDLCEDLGFIETRFYYNRLYFRLTKLCHDLNFYRTKF